MDERRIDLLARSLAASGTRRRVLRRALGALAAAGFAARPALAGGRAKQPTCGEEGEPCTTWVGCCDGLVCLGSRTNPNNGTCVPASEAPQPAPSPERRPRSERTRDPEPPGSTETTDPFGDGGTDDPTIDPPDDPTTDPTPPNEPPPADDPADDDGRPERSERTPRPRRSKVKITGLCTGTPDRIKVDNRNSSVITVEAFIGSEGRFEGSWPVAGKKHQTFLFGTATASGRAILVGDGEQELATESSPGPTVLVRTSIGAFKVRCPGSAPEGGEGQPGSTGTATPRPPGAERRRRRR